MSFKGYGPTLRALAAAGRTPGEIADLYGFDPAAVAWFLETPEAERRRIRARERSRQRYEQDASYRDRKRTQTLDAYWRRQDGPRTERAILAHTATRCRELIERGWSAARIARELDLDPDRVRDFARRLKPARGDRLTVPRTRAEQAQLERTRRKARARAKAREEAAAARAARWVDEWKAAAAEDERYRDPITPAAPLYRPLAHPGPEPEPVDLVEILEPEPGPEPSPSAGRLGAPDDAWGGWKAKGETHGKARLTEDQVRTIRAEHAAGRGLKELGARYGVHRQTIFMIVARKTWTHI